MLQAGTLLLMLCSSCHPPSQAQQARAQGRPHPGPDCGWAGRPPLPEEEVGRMPACCQPARTALHAGCPPLCCELPMRLVIQPACLPASLPATSRRRHILRLLPAPATACLPSRLLAARCPYCLPPLRACSLQLLWIPGPGGSRPIIPHPTPHPWHRYPYFTSLRHATTGWHYCGATLIQPDVLLTAAHVGASMLPGRQSTHVGAQRSMLRLRI